MLKCVQMKMNKPATLVLPGFSAYIEPKVRQMRFGVPETC